MRGLSHRRQCAARRGRDERVRDRIPSTAGENREMTASRVTAPADPQLPFCASIFPLIQFVSLTDFADWHSGFFERLARRLLPALPRVGRDAGAPEFDQLYAVAGRFTMLDRFRAGMLVRQLNRSLELPGDVIECGTGPGGVSLLMALLIRARGLNKRVWVFDSFEGLPPPDRNVDREYRAGACAYSLDRVSGLFREHGVHDMVELRKGWLAQTLPALSPSQRFCFAHVDVDLYGSVNDALRELYPRLAAGGAMVFDDYYDGSGGVFKGVNEAASRLGEVVHLGPTCQAFFSKGARPVCAWRIEAPDSRGAPLRVEASLDQLREFHSYIDLLAKIRDGLTPTRRRLLARLAPKELLPHPIDRIEASLEAYLRLLDTPTPPRGERFLLEPAGALVSAGASA